MCLSVQLAEIMPKWQLPALTLIPGLISNYIHHNMWNEITYPFPNFNSAIVEVCEWISNSSHSLPGMGLLIHAGIRVNPCY